MCGDLCLIYVYRHSISIVFYVYLFELDSDRIFHIYHWQGAKLNYAHTHTHTKHIIIIRLLRLYRKPKKNKYNSSQDKTKKNKTPFFLSRFYIFLPFFEELLSKLYIFPYSFFVLVSFLSLLVMILSLWGFCIAVLFEFRLNTQTFVYTIHTQRAMTTKTTTLFSISRPTALIIIIVAWRIFI